MSANMQDIKRRIKSVTSTRQITNAMKLVSASKLRKAKSTFEKTTKYFSYITNSIEEIFNNTSEVPEKYLAGNREIKRTCYIVVTSCKGLCGGFNINVIKEADRMLSAEPGEDPLIVAIGSKGKDYFEKRFNIYKEYLAPPENISFLETREISTPIIELYDKGDIDEIILIYTGFKNSIEQEVITKRLLPFDIEPNPDVLRHDKEVEYEPSVEAVFNYLVPKYVEIELYGAVVESATCEHAARRLAMENATDNANEMLGSLSLYYNRARQAAITNELVEIVAGSEALD
ncbi:MAG: ATP synthase F1 subunit gamma [Clostridiales bacterium]|nr:ATP synthase F1 subunit gamma [Clostridiales bacterium]MDD6389742.1 ATP synthase F1 subunit gamma [Bacillota bacterium]MDY5975298.1 ATP synthase F1 subunit gamma [Anaerovoracaceae bacterium]